MENTKENSEKIWKIRKITKLNIEKIWKIQKKPKLNCEMIWKLWKKGKSNSEKIWKIQKKIVKRYEKIGKYGRKVCFLTKQLILHVIYLSLHYALQLGGITLYLKGLLCNREHSSLWGGISYNSVCGRIILQ